MLLRVTLIVSLIGLSVGNGFTFEKPTFAFDKSSVNPLHPIHKEVEHHDPALKEVRTQLTCMIQVAYWALQSGAKEQHEKSFHQKSLAIIHAVFGMKPNLKEINLRTIDLAKHKLKLASDNIPNTSSDSGTFAITDPTDSKVYIYALYHAATSNDQPITNFQRARVLLHEASHAIKPRTTYDWWTVKEQKVLHVSGAAVMDHHQMLAKKKTTTLTADEEAKIIKTPLINGYWHSGYQILRDNASDRMHENADSWAVFGYACPHSTLPFPRDLNADVADGKSIVWGPPTHS
ncbi:hypothetical protein CVT24_012793 [Panaeolus cyanescens]|uniref:Lysine-specific metallo-endopeptidase domain-containing protein n=1 Tax=Panaeolus cyanescens TaxID=181874 RepID=A0A409W5Y0_9AGAR|nr:hypothetical protein CVT24_012793 [Panaeolus cyanescens]